MVDHLTWKSGNLKFLLDALIYQNSVLPDIKKIFILESGSHTAGLERLELK